ncbi:hypothetical protein C2869_04360 [Saccharobesus litoralis]|uniref:Uncharacterized protein n=1 Tax=Saccharobesus litoralis TaxID=2172099 RepID=A0A2S0VNG7_9ALTE|nr:hypothetical protein [Saccharobesus litoralis]AWB65719.1 hypothetical protein C2869_04360 [Saccharobesus litoralis]
MSAASSDFFFGDKKHLELRSICGLSDTVSDNHFSAQVNRYLAENNGKMDIFCKTTHPQFSVLLGKLNREQIGNLKIIAIKDRVPSIKATLTCSILLEQGIINIIPLWCACNKGRAEEIISTLLIPIHLMNLQSRTFLKEGKNLVRLDNDLEHEVRSVLALSLYPENFSFKFVELLKSATQIGNRNLSMQDALNKLMMRV